MWYPPATGGPLGAFGVNPDSLQALGLVAWWPTVRQRGAVLRDYAGRIAPAAFPGGTANPARVPQPVVDEALSFNGSAQYVNTGKSFSQAEMNPITVACWVRPLATAAGDFIKAAVAQDADTGGRAFAFGQMGDQLSTSKLLDALYIEMQHSGGGVYLFAPTAMTLGRWYHAAWTFDGTTHRLYQDGKVVASGALAAPDAATTTCTIGRRNYPGFEAYFNGHIADVRLYNRAVPPAVLYQLWDAPTRWDLYRPQRNWWSGVPALQSASPVSDVTAGTWTPSTGAALYAMLDEVVPDDTDTIQSSRNPNADTAEVALGPLVDPAASTDHVIRYRIRLVS